MLKPEFLPVDSIVEYNRGSIDKDDWQPKVITWKDISQLIESPYYFNKWHRPIPLTPEILTEWCNASNKLTEQYRIKDRLFVFRDGKCFDYGSNTQLDYLHELQLLFLGMKQVLPITIK